MFQLKLAQPPSLAPLKACTFRCSPVSLLTSLYNNLLFRFVTLLQAAANKAIMGHGQTGVSYWGEMLWCYSHPEQAFFPIAEDATARSASRSRV